MWIQIDKTKILKGYGVKWGFVQVEWRIIQIRISLSSVGLGGRGEEIEQVESNDIWIKLFMLIKDKKNGSVTEHGLCPQAG